MTDDLKQLATSTLIDDLAQHRRYRDRLVVKLGKARYDLREQDLLAALFVRGVQPEAVGIEDAPVVKPLRFQPLHDHVVVRPTEADSISEGGIILAETAKEKPMQGEVLAVGPGRVEPGIGTVVPTVQPGQLVLFGRYAGTEVVLDGQRVLILREEDVLGILRPEDA